MLVWSAMSSIRLTMSNLLGRLAQAFDALGGVLDLLANVVHAVVADEVQRLAERSSAATRQIETLVRAIQTDTNEAVISMEQTTTEVVRGARLAQDAGVALEEIEGVSKTLAALIQSISNAAQQQTSSAGQISLTMNVIQQITTQTSSGSTATAESIGNLAKMASQLRRSVSGFTLPPARQVDE